MKLFDFKESEHNKLNLNDCYIEHIEIMTTDEFNHIKDNIAEELELIERNIDWMWVDEMGNKRVILALDKSSGDGILIYSHDDFCAEQFCFVKNIKPQIDSFVEKFTPLFIELISETEESLDLLEVQYEHQVSIKHGNGITEMIQEQMKNIGCDIEFETDVYNSTLQKSSECQEKTMLEFGL